MANRAKAVPNAERHLRGLYEHLHANHRISRSGRSKISMTELTREYARLHGLPVRATLRLLDDLARAGALRRVWGRGARPKWRLKGG